MIKAILFDGDGVLLDMCEAHRVALNKALELGGYTPISISDHVSTYNGLPTKNKLEILISKGLINSGDSQKISQLKQRYTIEYIKKDLLPDESKIYLHKTLRILKMPTACVTNSIRQTAEMMLEKTGQLKYMQFVITNEDVRNPKPDPEGYFLAIQRLGVSPSEVLILEDSPKGIEAAEKTGSNILRVAGPHEVTWANIYRTMKLYD